MAQQHKRGFWAVIVKLTNEGGQHLLDRKLPVVAREIGSVAPILAAAEEEDLDASLTASLICGDHVGINNSRDVNVLMPLDQRQGADSIADQGRCLEIQNLCCALHFHRQ